MCCMSLIYCISGECLVVGLGLESEDNKMEESVAASLQDVEVIGRAADSTNHRNRVMQSMYFLL